MPTSTAVSPVPQPRGAIPYLTIKGAADAISFYQRVFGAEVAVRLDAPDGVLHAELKVGPQSFMLSEERPQMGARGPATIGGSGSTTVVYVPDTDATLQRAVEAGAKLTMPAQDQFWGDRAGGFIDPFGHQWMVNTQRESVTPEELQRRVQAMMQQR